MSATNKVTICAKVSSSWCGLLIIDLQSRFEFKLEQQSFLKYIQFHGEFSDAEKIDQSVFKIKNNKACFRFHLLSSHMTFIWK